MAKVIENATESKGDGSAGRPIKYPWDKWSDGKTRRAKKGADFNCSVAGFCGGLYNWAKANEFKAHVVFKNDKIVEFYIDKGGE